MSLDVRRSLRRLKQSAADAGPPAHSPSPNSPRRSQIWRAAGTGCPVLQTRASGNDSLRSATFSIATPSGHRQRAVSTTKPTPMPWATSVKIVASFRRLLNDPRRFQAATDTFVHQVDRRTAALSRLGNQMNRASAMSRSRRFLILPSGCAAGAAKARLCTATGS